MSNSRRPILVVGSINIDLVANAERIPVSGETVRGLDFRTHPGGKGANQAVAVARLGYPVRMLGKVGNDEFGAQLRSGLQATGVDVSLIEAVEGSSGVAVIIVSSRGENVIIVTPGANAALTPADLDRNLEAIRGACLVLTQLEIPIDTTERLAELCEREGVPLMLDPAPARELSSKVVGQARWFTPNETEAGFYMGGSTGNSPESVAARLLEHGAAAVVLKLGSSGVFLRDRHGLRLRIPAFPVHAVDTTAAGDAFNGAFATGLALGRPPEESARFAVAAAALSVTRAGAQSSMPSAQEVSALLAGAGSTPPDEQTGGTEK